MAVTKTKPATAKNGRAKAKPAPIPKPTAGGQIEHDEMSALEAIRDDVGRDRTSTSFLVRLAILRLLSDHKSKRVDYTTSLDDVRKSAGLKTAEKAE